MFVCFSNQKKCASNERNQLQSVCIKPDASVIISYVYDTSSVYLQLTDKNSLNTIEEILQEIGAHCQTGIIDLYFNKLILVTVTFSLIVFDFK